MPLTIAPTPEYVAPIYGAERPTAEMNARVLVFTQEVFPGGNVSLHTDLDPEFGYECTVVDVRFRGSQEDIIERDRRWSKGWRQVVRGYRWEYCLSVCPIS